MLGTKTLCLFCKVSKFLRAFFSFFVQSLTQQRYIYYNVEIVRENWEVVYFYRENEASIFYAKIQVNLCFRWNMQVVRRRAKWKLLHYQKEMDK